MNIEEAIKTSLEYETKVRDVYIKAMKTVEDPAAKKIFNTMAKEEQGHLDYLNDRLRTWNETGKLDAPTLATIVPSKTAIEEGIKKLSPVKNPEGRGGEMEILTLNSTLEGERIGTSMVLEAIATARREGCPRICLTTTNANLRAIGFYQRLGFRLVAINRGVVDEARKTKPEIPETGEGGIPIHDEIVMDLELEPYLDD